MTITRTAISMAALAAAVFFAGFALPYLALDPTVLARYASRQGWVLVHVGAGAVALLVGRTRLSLESLPS